MESLRFASPANPRSSAEAAALLKRLYETAGSGIITGQHTQTRKMEEIGCIRSLTGREPALRGFELLSYSPNINYEDASEACLTEIEENRETMQDALAWAEGHPERIVTLSFHWFSPIGGRDKSFYAENTDFDASRILIDGSEERAAFYRDLDVIAELLGEFRDRKIPLLWRPLHESDGTWFWWGAKGPAVARDLYRLIFDYYTEEKDLNNLLWVWNCRLAEGYPGDPYVDVISLDEYLTEYEPTDYAGQYRTLREQTGSGKVAALAEVGYLPDIRKLKASRTPWAYYMTWSREFCIGETYNAYSRVKELYEDPYAVSLQSAGDCPLGQEL